MGIIRRSLKAYFIAVCVFLLMTIIQAALLQLTSYHESWSFYGLIAAFSVSTLLLGIMEGRLIGKRGLLVGILSAVLFLFMVLLAAGGFFGEGMSMEKLDVSYLIPILTGAAGGILGANSGKS